MKRSPAWIKWVVLTVGIWTCWMYFVVWPLHGRSRSLEAQIMDIDARRGRSEQMVATAPAIVAQLEAVTDTIRWVTDSFATTGSITRLLSELRAAADSHNVSESTARPSLESTLDLTRVTDQNGSKVAFDTLIVEFSAAGAFSAIGGWLDKIEKRADFQQWRSCLWRKDEDERLILFSGRAAFWIVVALPDPKQQTDASL